MRTPTGQIPTDQILTAALAPVRDTLLAAARADAARTRAQADAAAATTLAAGQAAATRIREEARAQGAASGAAASAAQRSLARRTARAEVLRAQRDTYEQLRAAARQAMARVPAGPGYPLLRQRLVTAVTAALGDGAVVRDAPGGGVIGEAPGRRVDYSLAGFADRAVRAVMDAS